MNRMTSRIRFATPADAPAVLEIYGPFCEDSPVSFEILRPTLPEIESRIMKVIERFPWLVCESENEVLGYAYASSYRDRAAYRWSVEVAIYIAEKSRGQGFGTTLYTLLFELLRIQSYYHAYAGITLPNPGSLLLHERLGFEPVGIYKSVGYKAGAWHDVSWWALALRTAEGVPEEVLSIQDALRRADFREAIAFGQSPLPS